MPAFDKIDLAQTPSRFRDIPSKVSSLSSEDKVTVSWNPCKAWTLESASEDTNYCKNVAVCMNFV